MKGSLAGRLFKGKLWGGGGHFTCHGPPSFMFAYDGLQKPLSPPCTTNNQLWYFSGDDSRNERIKEKPDLDQTIHRSLGWGGGGLGPRGWSEGAEPGSLVECLGPRGWGREVACVPGDEGKIALKRPNQCHT